MLLNKEKRKKKTIGEKCWTVLLLHRLLVRLFVRYLALYSMRWGLVHKYLSGWTAFWNRWTGLVFTAMRIVFNVIYWESSNRWCHWCCCCCYDRLLPFLQRLSKALRERERSICKVTQTYTQTQAHTYIYISQEWKK